MEALSISWLVTSATAPLVVVLALWTLYVFHTYRRRWRTVDLFLLAIISQELILAIFTFCFALVSLVGGQSHPLPCTVGQFGLVAVRTFQVATLASMVVDRALTVRWPYRYRFSVRRNQIRYHVSVLALVSILVGVAGVFARLKPNTNICSLHPSQWDVRYVLFLLCLYAFLILASLICMVQVEVHRVRHGTKESGSFQLPECVSPDLPTGMNSPLDTQSSTGSTRALHRPSRQASRRPYAKNNKGTSDLRWPSVALTCLLCFLINHIPYLVSTFHFIKCNKITCI
ncbi:g_PROTEIN_RECEP_F1_2 domain-containing protein [Caerostris darwini]|uniref:G_PROTEIN_RECEP_F1_2 domain-containing protein n=1 Tax=Caerostris darwini TaxID=1538125 RepID=A0AAV4RR15_9ARAC|nr:g_PROTEIN_RECEP_F1_2 domain-containing protein [Caerostris darwini]